jgi:hypothetical protein
MIMLSMVLQSAFAHIADKFQREEGQDFAEYAIILALVVIGAAVAFSGLASAITTGLGTVAV